MRHRGLREIDAYLSPATYFPIVLSYSQYHYYPDRITGYEQTSAGRLARNIHEALLCHAPVKYADRPGNVTCDLLFTIDNWERCANVRAKRLIVFPAVAHWRYTTRILSHYAPLFGVKPLERMHNEHAVLAFERWIARTDLLVLIGNEYVADTYLSCKFPSKKLHVINCGVDTHYFVPAVANQATPPVRFIFPATQLSLSKGTPFVFRAWRAIAEAFPDAELWVIGQTKSDIGIEEYTSLPRVKFFGWIPPGVSTYRKLLQSAHYVVFPSLSEGQAGTLLEAMSCGCVPIATRASGIDADRYGGLVVPLADVDGLINAMFQAATDFDQWAQHSVITRQMVERNHTWEQFRAQIYSLSFGDQ